MPGFPSLRLPHPKPPRPPPPPARGKTGLLSTHRAQAGKRNHPAASAAGQTLMLAAGRAGSPLSVAFPGCRPLTTGAIFVSLHLWHVRGSHDVPAGRQEHARPIHDATSPPGSGPPAWLSAPPELPCVPALDSAPGDQPALGVRLAGQSRFLLPPRPLAARVPVSEAAAASGVFLVRRRSSLL